jgi:hypothetical protein
VAAGELARAKALREVLDLEVEAAVEAALRRHVVAHADLLPHREWGKVFLPLPRRPAGRGHERGELRCLVFAVGVGLLELFQPDAGLGEPLQLALAVPPRAFLAALHFGVPDAVYT